MNNLKQDPVGIDIPIQMLQTELYNRLVCTWQLGENDYAAFGRAYNNQTKTGYVPEFYTDGMDYSELLLDDTVCASSFFALSDKVTIAQGNMSARVALIFHVNLELLHKYTPHRADEEVRNDVFNLLQECAFGFRPRELVLGIKNVYAEYTGVRVDEKLKYRDMHPHHCFRFNMDLNYSPICNVNIN